MLKDCKARIYLAKHTSAISISLRSAALGTKSVAIVRAKQSHRKSEQKLFAKRLIYVELVSFKDHVLIDKLFKSILGNSSLEGYRTLKVKRENSVNRSKTSRAFTVVNKLCFKLQTHITAVIGKSTGNVSVLKLYSVDLLG